MVSVTAHISGHCFHGNQPGACTDRLTEHTVSQGETDNYSSLKAGGHWIILVLLLSHFVALLPAWKLYFSTL